MDMKMDVKDIVAKFKSKGDGRRGGGISAFFEKNPMMKIIIPAIAVAISVLIALFVIIGKPKNKVDDYNGSNSVTTQSQEVENLPQDVREAENLDGIEDVSLFNEAALAHPRVSAIIENKEGYYTAVVETDNAHYPNLMVGQYVPGSDWLVENISETEVVFDCNGQKVTVKVALD